MTPKGRSVNCRMCLRELRRSRDVAYRVTLTSPQHRNPQSLWALCRRCYHRLDRAVAAIADEPVNPVHRAQLPLPLWGPGLAVLQRYAARPPASKPAQTA